ncbi:hypothetical protein RRG08_049402 [Elysia crispata]|uniref:Uncharacterized protein n=1 Tax=Elysia crispata TaxID=231223 RepID=A0AAE1CES3_9GAST|nr:hypothetical protein RRG08_049402 [Elysia crispata]
MSKEAIRTSPMYGATNHHQCAVGNETSSVILYGQDKVSCPPRAPSLLPLISAKHQRELIQTRTPSRPSMISGRVGLKPVTSNQHGPHTLESDRCVAEQWTREGLTLHYSLLRYPRLSSPCERPLWHDAMNKRITANRVRRSTTIPSN